MPQTREHILLARQVEVPSIVVALNDFGPSYQLGHAYLTPPQNLTQPQQWLNSELQYQIPGTIAAIFNQHYRDETPRIIDILTNGRRRPTSQHRRTSARD